MSAPAPGKMAPPISLPGVSGDHFDLDKRRGQGPVVVAFFKVSCPTCQYAFPYLERIFRLHPAGKVTWAGISQNEKRDTQSFAERFGITFPLYLDDTQSYPVSNRYGLSYVPSIFLVSPEGKVELASVGWLRPDIEELNTRLARAAGEPPAEIFSPGEEVVDFMAG
ncbi:MAG: peroxiredoxin family protein [Terriglobales bacterium]